MVEDVASRGFGRQAAIYREARPAYHPTVVAEVVRNIGDGAVVELGAGTGIFTAELMARGVDVIAVEPVEAMRDQLISAVAGVDVRAGSAEAIPVGSDTAAAVVVAQAFHWFETASALDEIARVLQSGGKLITVWNVRDQSVPWVAAYTEIVDEYSGETPRHRTMKWRRSIESDSRFSLVQELAVDNPQPADADRVVARAVSTSFIGSLPDDQLEHVALRIREVVGGLGDHFDYPYRSELEIWAFEP